MRAFNLKTKDRAFHAVTWLHQNPVRTQVTASQKFSVSQSAISNEKRRQTDALEYCHANPKHVDKFNEARICDPSASIEGIARYCNFDRADVEMIELGLKVWDARNNANSAPNLMECVEYRLGIRQGHNQMRAKCASLMRAIAGEHGEAMAQAIEAITEV